MRAFKPSACGILVYRETTSSEKRYLGIVLKHVFVFSMRFIACVVSLTYVGKDVTRGWSKVSK